MSERYLKQAIVVDKSLSMPSGKLAAMVAHAAMTFVLKRLRSHADHPMLDGQFYVNGYFPTDEWRWLTELDPGLEKHGQVSMAKIVCAANSHEHLLQIELAARDAGLTVHRVIDSGHSHNKPGTLACIAIGPHWPEDLEPVTGKLKVYR